MKINVAKSAGFCFGVRRALDIALKAARSGLHIEMLGDIVHNEEVVKEITTAGIKKIKRPTRGENKTLLIRAHGADDKTFKKARSLGYKILDATCPKVKEIHKIAKGTEEKGYRIIVVGDRRHDEVKGIVGQIESKAIVIDGIKDIPLSIVRQIKRAAVVVQSTQNLQKVSAIVRILRQHIGELKFFNTICKPTSIKQEEARIMPLKNEVMIIIGSKTSANTRRLYEISKRLNKRSYWIQSKGQIKARWFKDVRSVGITAGASTPDATTRDVVRYIRSIGEP